MKTYLLAMCLVCTLVNAQTDYTFRYDSEKFKHDGLTQFEQGKFEDAIKEYSKIDELDPDFPSAQFEIGYALFSLGDTIRTKEFLTKGIQREDLKDDISFNILYGSYLSEHKAYEQSEAVFRHAETLAPNYANLYYNLGLLYIRWEKRQKAVDMLEKCIEINPNYKSAYYMLGLVALEDGRVAEGTMALTTYLLVAPTGKNAENAVLKLNEKFGENYLDESKLVFSKDGDNYEELNVILRNQLALRDAYKVKSNFTDPVVRQIQAVAEYATEHQGRQGFFERNMIPWLAKMYKDNQFEPFSYYMLQSMEKTLGKKLTAEKKKIKDFGTYLDNGGWDALTTRSRNISGKPVNATILFNDDGDPYLAGEKINGKLEGPALAYSKYGDITAEINFKNNEIDGPAKYYDEKKHKKEEKSFKSGKLDGTRTVYYTNGNINLTENYKNGVLDGPAATYYVNGGKNCEVNYINGERDGAYACDFSTGSKKIRAHYINGKMDGFYESYNVSGELTEKYPYKMGEIEGVGQQFYAGNKLKSEGDFVKSNYNTYYKEFGNNGDLSQEQLFEKSIISRYSEYNPNKTKSFETTYDSKGLLASRTYYDITGAKYFQEEYKSGEIKKTLQYARGKDTPEENDVTKKPLLKKNYDGAPLTMGSYEKGKKNGTWKYFYDSGQLKEIEEYTGGIKSGLDKSYSESGETESTVNYLNDSISGIYETYRLGKLSSKRHFIHNELSGPSYYYRPDGSTSSKYFYSNGEPLKGISYWQNGNISLIETYIENTEVSFETFSPEGKKENDFEYKNKNGEFILPYYGGKTSHVINIKNGILNGKYVIRDQKGNILKETNYMDGIEVGKSVEFGPTGKPLEESNLVNGKLEGKLLIYDLAGNLRLDMSYLNGESNGKLTRYALNKMKQYEYNLVDGAINGAYMYYNLSGKPVLKLMYNDKVQSYAILDKDGNIGPDTPIKNETADIISKYPNGKTAIELHLNKGYLDGKLAIFGEAGFPEIESDFNMFRLNGERKQYYPSGKIYKKETFVMDNHEGMSYYYYEDGKPMLTANYKNDALNGECKIYNEGKTITKIYDTDVLIETK